MSLIQDCLQQSQWEEGQGDLRSPPAGSEWESAPLPLLQWCWEGAGPRPLALTSLWGAWQLLPQEQGCRHPWRGLRGFPAGGEAGAGLAPPVQQPLARPFPPQRTLLSTHVPKAERKARGWQMPPLLHFLSVEQKAVPGQRWGTWGHGGTLLSKVLASLRPPRLEETSSEHLQLLLPAHPVPLAPGVSFHSGCWGQSWGPLWVPAPSSARAQEEAEKQ